MVLLCGVDEAGRGPWAGPVFAAAVILDPQRPIGGLKDSKCLSPAKRKDLATRIHAHALAVHVASSTVAEIESLNILQATLLAMKRAVSGLTVQPDKVLVDGPTTPRLSMATEGIVRGDQLVPAISAASILAKVTRDAFMIEQHECYPMYGFDRHKGYGTLQHRYALQQYGPCSLHRRNFRPVEALLRQN